MLLGYKSGEKVSSTHFKQLDRQNKKLVEITTKSNELQSLMTQKDGQLSDLHNELSEWIQTQFHQNQRDWNFQTKDFDRKQKEYEV